jgi:hypothetical protein
LTRAIKPAEVNVPRVPGETIAAIAAIAIATAATRQNVSWRRIRRRSTIISESGDIEILLKIFPAGFAPAA